jgi:hypothetical protein
VSKRIRERISIAEIDTSDLVPVTVRGILEETITTTILERGTLFRKESTRITTREVRIPAWVHKSATPANETMAISLQDFEDSKSELWMSITELRMSNLKIPATKGHHYEWLSAGQIPKFRIIRVMPFDGIGLHKEEKEGHIVRSLYSTQPWIYAWKLLRWILDLELWKKAVELEKKTGTDQVMTMRPTKRRRRGGLELLRTIRTTLEDEEETEESEVGQDPQNEKTNMTTKTGVHDKNHIDDVDHGRGASVEGVPQDISQDAGKNETGKTAESNVCPLCGK